MTEESYKETRTIRKNPRMLRDCWWDGDIFVIRQVNFNPDGAVDKSKVIRLSLQEVGIMTDEIERKDR